MSWSSGRDSAPEPTSGCSVLGKAIFCHTQVLNQYPAMFSNKFARQYVMCSNCCSYTDIIIEECVVFTDPYEEADEQLKQEREEEEVRQKREEEQERKKKAKKKEGEKGLAVYRQGIGKYINAAATKRAAETGPSEAAETKKKKDATYNFGNFSTW
ncbi:peptidyl-prolyl cis-trans isomerase-like 2 [Elysia marginata]|uniref:Peptidyl-prolyl cis-trans isomerase-like 2 n=1 Tax=Elysia marginata TaxID=1093978 RepID=A0AAV4FJ95_9GAST|nr:peptidyl-prolyl cis-trans isomerase-like 2 [Elysia marginata]